MTLDDDYISWLATWAWRFHAIVVFVPGHTLPQPLFLVLPLTGRC